MDTFGILAGVAPTLSAFAILAIFLGMGFVGLPIIAWTAVTAGLFWLYGVHAFWWIVVGAPLLLMSIPPLRQIVVSRPVLSILRKVNFLPEISETERVAIEAGSTWIDKDLFSGKPNFKKILNEEPYRKVSGEEQAFIDGPCEELCRMVTDWEIYQNKDLPKRVWDHLKRERFFGMIIPKEYGGLGFSAVANSEVVAKLGSRSQALAVTVMVPNSLGPAELLSHYGTDKQKSYYLPRLASGEEIPCFALTEPNAGSDAGSIASTGEVFTGEDGKLYLKLNWKKRYITLAAVSTIIGLAVKIKDPKNLLGKGEEPGITAILVPANLKGVVLGQRHDPMGVPFFNCPTEGHDVIVSVDQIIGGVDYVGRGWQMITECLSAGRAISLPALSTGGTKFAARVVSAYSAFRRQFGIPIGKFEGVEEPLARIFGLSYLMEANRIFTVGAVDKGLKPSVVSAIAKYNSTELGRKTINDAMDILGGAAISRGPRNLLANGYIAAPIGITVEGANILTRTMIIFGQGAIRCHPYIYQEMRAIMDNDAKAFDRNFWAHIGHVIRNKCRMVLLSLTRGRLASVPGGEMATYWRKLAWASATFSFYSDVALGAFGGKLKFREKITGRYADILSWMYMATATLKRFEAEGRRPEHAPFVHWSLQFAMARIQEGFDNLFANFDVPVLKHLLRGPVQFWSRLNRLHSEPSDELGHKIVDAMLVPGALRDSITGGIFLPTDVTEALGRYENAFRLVHDSGEVIRKVTKASREKKISKGRPERLIDEALAAGVISNDEANMVRNAEIARNDAVQVDAFNLEEYAAGVMGAPTSKAPLANVASGGR